MNLNLCTFVNIKFVIENEYAKWTRKERRRKTAGKYKMGTVKECVNQFFFPTSDNRIIFYSSETGIENRKI